MRYTLLDMTQRILESMESDEVNSFKDTVESNAVASIIKETYFYLVGKMDLPSTHTIFKLDSSTDSTKPVLMTVPREVFDIDYIKYQNLEEDGRSDFDEIKFLELEDFLERSLNLDDRQDNVDSMVITIDNQEFKINFYNNREPDYWTTIDDTLILFDGIDLVKERNLQSFKTLCYGKKALDFQMKDTFIPKLDPDQFQLLLNESRSQAFIELKQTNNPTSDIRARKSFIHTQRTKRNIPTRGVPYRGYGRATAGSRGRDNYGGYGSYSHDIPRRLRSGD